MIQEQYDAGQEMSNIPKFISEPKTVGKVLSVLLLIFSTIIGLNSCKTSDCLKAEESRFAQYLYVITNDSATTSDSTKIIRTTDENGKPYTVFRNNAGQDLTFDCKRRYTKKYIRKQLGKPLRIYISDKEQRQYKYWRNSVYEEWIYPLNIEYHPNKKPFICKILVLRFEGSSNKLRRQGNCPELKCHDYSFYGGGEGCYDLIFGIINSDSFDIKYPYILKNEQVWFFCN